MPGVLTCLSCVLLNLKQNDLINRMKSPKKMKNPSSVQTIIPIAVAVDLENKIKAKLISLKRHTVLKCRKVNIELTKWGLNSDVRWQRHTRVVAKKAALLCFS